MRYDKGLLAVLTLALAGPAFAQEGPPRTDEPLPIIRTTDGSMTCLQVGEEAAQLSQTMESKPDGGVFGMLGGVARSGAAMLIPGAGLAMAGVDVLTKPGEDRREAADLAVQNRWYYLNGLYAGRQCREQAEAATTTPSAVAGPAVTSTPAMTPTPVLTPSSAPTPPVVAPNP